MENMAPVRVSFEPDENGLWIGSCPDLDLATQGKTFEEAQYNLKDAIMLFFESCIRRGTLDEVLKQAGYEPVQQERVHNYIDYYHPQSPVRREVCHA